MLGPDGATIWFTKATRYDQNNSALAGEFELFSLDMHTGEERQHSKLKAYCAWVKGFGAGGIWIDYDSSGRNPVRIDGFHPERPADELGQDAGIVWMDPSGAAPPPKLRQIGQDVVYVSALFILERNFTLRANTYYTKEPSPDFYTYDLFHGTIDAKEVTFYDGYITRCSAGYGQPRAFLELTRSHDVTAFRQVVVDLETGVTSPVSVPDQEEAYKTVVRMRA